MHTSITWAEGIQVNSARATSGGASASLNDVLVAAFTAVDSYEECADAFVRVAVLGSRPTGAADQCARPVEAVEVVRAELQRQRDPYVALERIAHRLSGGGKSLSDVVSMAWADVYISAVGDVGVLTAGTAGGASVVELLNRGSEVRQFSAFSPVAAAPQHGNTCFLTSDGADELMLATPEFAAPGGDVAWLGFDHYLDALTGWHSGSSTDIDFAAVVVSVDA